MSNWVDFRQIKEQVSFSQVLPYYGLTLVAKGAELTGRCPFHEDTKPSFHVNLEKRAYHCFGCGAKGNVLDFVAAMEKVSIRDAALKLAERFGVEQPGSEVPPVPPAVALPALPTATSAKKTPTAETNKPLTFTTLKYVDSGHPYLTQRGISRELAEKFGVGFYSGKGVMRGRVVIPIHNAAGELVAYAGRVIDDSEPRYKLPNGFQKSQILFNLHRAKTAQGTTESVIVVEGFFDCLKVVQAGFPSVVALMGVAMSDEQLRLLLEHFNAITLLLDGDEAGQKASDEITARLVERCFIRRIRLPPDRQPDQLTAAEINIILGGPDGSENHSKRQG